MISRRIVLTTTAATSMIGFAVRAAENGPTGSATLTAALRGMTCL